MLAPAPPALDPRQVDDVHARVLAWYATEARDLPWRRTRDPYAILVAEVMLQQTQVDRVVPRWHAWLQRFPTIAALASATRADAIRAWQGLGYNLRAVRLHDIACQVVAQHGGALPRDLDGLLALKGVGRYTAGAVACFAYEQPVAMVDTNVRRVLSRVFAVAPLDVAGLANEVLPPAPRAYSWNQALMDLGATVCRAGRPMCLLCPLVGVCPGPAPERPGRGSEAARAASLATAPGPFRGSARYYRGRLVDALRHSPEPNLRLDALVERVAAPGDSERVEALVATLVRDGLLHVDEARRVSLPA